MAVYHAQVVPRECNWRRMTAEAVALCECTIRCETDQRSSQSQIQSLVSAQQIFAIL